MGVLYGVFVRPLWSESVEFGQVWAGMVQYETTNPWYSTIVSAPSLQITIPALLLLAGFDPWHLSLVSTAFFCAIAFSATAAAGYAYSRHWGLSVCIPLLLLTYGFANSHGYPVLFPVNYFQFGQTGQYLALLALALAACGWPLAAGFFGGLLAGAHAVWCAAFAIGAFRSLPGCSRGSSRGLLLRSSFPWPRALLLQGFGESVMPPKLQLSPPPIPAGVGAAPPESMTSLGVFRPEFVPQRDTHGRGCDVERRPEVQLP